MTKQRTSSAWLVPEGSVEQRVFVAYWFFVGWWSLSLGASIDIRGPNLEIHLPFGFLRIGWRWEHTDMILICEGSDGRHCWGYNA